MEQENKLSKEMKAVEIIGFTLTAATGFTLNFIVIVAVAYIRKPYICTKIAMHLSISNITACILVIVLHGFGDSWLLLHDTCRAFLVFKSFWFASTILMTSFLVYEGLLKVRHRLNRVNKGEMVKKENCLDLKFTLVLLWCSSLTIAFLTFLLTNMSDKQLCISYQHTRKDLVRFFYGFVVILPLFVLVMLNIYYKRQSIKHKRSVGMYTKDTRQRIIQRDFHYMKSSFRVAQVLMLAWLPHTIYIFCLIDWFIDKISFQETAYHILKFLQWFCYSACLLQPVVLILTNYQIKIIVEAKFKTIWYSFCGDARSLHLEDIESNPRSLISMQKSQTSLKNNKPQSNNEGTDNHIRPEGEETNREEHQRVRYADGCELYSPGRQIVVVHNSSSEQSEVHKDSTETEGEALDYRNSFNEQSETHGYTETEGEVIYYRNNSNEQSEIQRDTRGETEDEEMYYRYPDSNDDSDGNSEDDEERTLVHEEEKSIRKEEEQGTKHNQEATSPTSDSTSFNSPSRQISVDNNSSGEQADVQGDLGEQEHLGEETRDVSGKQIMKEEDNNEVLIDSLEHQVLTGKKSIEQAKEDDTKEDVQSDQRPSINVDRMFSLQNDDDAAGSRCDSAI